MFSYLFLIAKNSITPTISPINLEINPCLNLGQYFLYKFIFTHVVVVVVVSVVVVVAKMSSIYYFNKHHTELDKSVNFYNFHKSFRQSFLCCGMFGCILKFEEPSLTVSPN
jgi:hypothetical protein